MRKCLQADALIYRRLSLMLCFAAGHLCGTRTPIASCSNRTRTVATSGACADC